MFTREEIFEFFALQYTTEQVEKALHILAEHSDIDPNAAEFPASITEQLEQIFKVVQAAVDSQKALTGDSAEVGNLAQVEQQCIDIANARSLDIPTEIFEGMTQLLVGEGIAQATIQYQIVDAARRQTLSQLQSNSLADCSQETAARIAQISALFSDPNTLDKILDDYGLKGVGDANSDFNNLTNTCTIDFDPDAFLKEKGVENPSQKKKLTIHDTQAMVRSLVRRNLK